MKQYSVSPIAEEDPATREALRELNNRHIRETSFLSPEKWQRLINEAFQASCVAEAAGFMIAFQQDARYDSENFNWFCQRHQRFVYVDRIVVDGRFRGQGLARLLYEELFALAREKSHDKVFCEVNLDPPNPGSDAFHAGLGFVELGRGRVRESGRVVRYLSKSLV